MLNRSEVSHEEIGVGDQKSSGEESEHSEAEGEGMEVLRMSDEPQIERSSREYSQWKQTDEIPVQLPISISNSVLRSSGEEYRSRKE